MVPDTKKIDKELFGPVLQVVRVPDWGRAIYEANNTNFGLAAGLISNNKDLWETFRNNVRAGIVNFNRPTTGAASFLPFGGPGFSGNHNPGAYYSADFCAWPMASQISNKPSILELDLILSNASVAFDFHTISCGKYYRSTPCHSVPLGFSLCCVRLPSVNLDSLFFLLLYR